MKKIISNLVFVAMLLLITNVSATTNQYIEFSSGETDDNAIYLESYEDYLNALGQVDEQKLYKEDYLEYLEEKRVEYNLPVENTVKAQVLKVESTVEEYGSDGYGPYKIRYQPLTIQILEGEYKNKTLEIIYVLTVDTYENINVQPVRANQKINVFVEKDDDGNLYGYATTVDAASNRLGLTILVLIIAILFIGIYLGKKGLKMLPHMILLADIILLVFVPEIITGRSIIWLTIVTMIAYIIVDTAIKVGINAKMIASLISTVSIILVTTLALLMYNYIANISGITYEIKSIVEVFPNGTIDFYNLNLCLYILMATIIVSDISCKIMNTNIEKKDEIKEYVAGKLPTVFGILLITMMPKYLCLLISKYSFTELLNSEMLTNEIIRILFLIISMTLTTQVAVYVKKMFVEEKK